jgi:hypothetical protein
VNENASLIKEGRYHVHFYATARKPEKSRNVLRISFVPEPTISAVGSRCYQYRMTGIISDRNH